MKTSSALLLPGLSEEAILRWMVLILSFLIGGVAGICAVVIAQLLMNLSKRFGHNDTSRFGGVVVVAFFFLSQMWFVGTTGLIEMSSQSMAMMAAGMALFAYGVYQEIFGAFPLKVSFIVLVVFFSSLLAMNEGLVLQATSFAWVDSLLAGNLMLAIVCTLLMLAYSVFAFNTANGANGLVPVVSIFIVIGLAQTGLGALGSMLSLVAVGCVIFMLFNVTVGRIYIGSGGTYFLGGVLGLAFVHVLNLQQVDVWYLLCLFFYPNANLLFSLVRRLSAGKAFFGDDNGHLHNLLYRRLGQYALLKKHANTLSGLMIGVVFTGLPLALANTQVEYNWLVVYAVMWALYAVSWGMLADRKTKEVEFLSVSSQ